MKSHKMKVADCYGRNFYSFPKCIATDYEVIELSFNRIRTLAPSELQKFKYLKFLYLTDNLISLLDEETFEGMNSLSTLDLALNALVKVPKTLFQLPALKSLYLSQNVNINIAETAEEVKPILSPLTLLDISYISVEEPTDFPDFGSMPLLATLNITKNQYKSVKPNHFAGLCNLQVLVTNNVTIEFENDCDCWIINNWLTERNVIFLPLGCPVQENRCSNAIVNEEDKNIFVECRKIYEQIQMSQKIMKIGIGIGIAVVVIALAGFIYYIWIRRKRRNQQRINQNDENTVPTDSLVLLNKQTNNLTK
ncbi:hypothetical protein NQ317_010431 [Molorchus minor]|uniref:Uncharacterized protein n=1 Tax=Molorchus minor TaxID=1323400 RepID=A0ABQ9JWW6_9CUCU|nr:hypothetical protein NQ317_010431 [Molorchus minor]